MKDLFERRVFHSKEDGGWIAIAPELPGCSAFGKTDAQALKELGAAISLWVGTAKSKKMSVPVDPPADDFHAA